MLWRFSIPGHSRRWRRPRTARRTVLLSTVLFLLLCAPSGHAGAADLWIIANSALPLTPGELKEVFLGEKQFGGGIKLYPVDNAASQSAFLATILGMPGGRYHAAWLKKSFRDALNPPPQLSSDAQVLEFVQLTPGAVGYVSTPPVGVIVLQKY